MPTRLRLATLLVAFLHLIDGSGCASRVPDPAPGTSTLAGRLTLRAPAADSNAASGPAAYGDRRLRDAARVDYSRPGFAVVHVELAGAATLPPPPGETVRVELIDGPARLRIEPAEIALRAGSRLVIRNSSRDAHVVSIPRLGRVAALEPGSALEVEVDQTGDLALHVLDRPDTSALVFSVAGPFVRVADSGRFALTDLPPGTHRLHVWHSRLPPTSTLVELQADRIERVELSLGSPDPHGD